MIPDDVNSRENKKVLLSESITDPGTLVGHDLLFLKSHQNKG